MKVPIAISFLALASTILANTVNVKRVQTLQIHNFSASQLSNESVGTLQFSIREQSTNLRDECNITWNTTGSIQPGLEPNRCQRGNFEFGFRYGIGNIENFALVVGRTNASEKGTSVVSAYRVNPSWICMVDPEAGVRERCVWNGVLSIDINTV